MWEVWQYCAASLAVLQYEEAGRRYPGTGRTGHEYSSTDTWPYHSVSPCQVWQYGADFLMYPSIASHSSRTDTLYLLAPGPSSLRLVSDIVYESEGSMDRGVRDGPPTDALSR